MRFFNTLVVAASALASFAVAQSTVIKFTKVPTAVQVGNSYSIEWTTTDNTTPITIKLRVGDSDALTDVSVLTASASGGKYTWTPEKGLGDSPNYALEIIQGKEVNYSGKIVLTGGSASSVHATASASSASASASSASSASASSISSFASNSTLSTATLTAASSSGTASAASKSGSSSSGSLTAAATKTTGAASSTESAISAPTSTGAADKMTMGSSPMALIFGAVVAMAYLN